MISKPSKSARKRAFHALQELGEQLIELTRAQLDELDLDERLLDAIVNAKSITSHGALRRQKQLIGKLMRDVDPVPIQQVLDAFNQDGRDAKKIFRDAELWRNRLTGGNADELQAYFDFLGREDSAVADSFRAYHGASHDKARKEAARQIFRDVHQEIESKVQKTPRSI